MRLSFNCQQISDLCLKLLSEINVKLIDLKKMFQNKQNLNKCKNSLTKLINDLKEMNKTLNNNNLINESIDQNYDHFEEVIDCRDEDNYNMFTKDMVIKDKHLIIKQPIIQFTVNNKLLIINYLLIIIIMKTKLKTKSSKIISD
jgi:hypothetical protein